MKCKNNQTNCNCDCIIASLCTIFKVKSTENMGIWQCPRCGWHSLDQFPTPEDIKKYKEEGNEKNI